MASILVDGIGIDVEGFVCAPRPREGAYVSIRFRTSAVLHHGANAPPPRHEVRLGFEVDGSVYNGIFRMTAFTPGPGDLLVMGGSCQRTWQHAVPKVAQAGPRISITFRHPPQVGGRPIRPSGAVRP